jgi:hypothetical protein
MLPLQRNYGFQDEFYHLHRVGLFGKYITLEYLRTSSIITASSLTNACKMQTGFSERGQGDAGAVHLDDKLGSG